MRRLPLLLPLFAGVLAPLLLFAKLSHEIRESQHGKDDGFWWDDALLNFLHHHASPARDALAIFFTRLGGPFSVMTVSMLIFVALLVRHRRFDALFWGLATGGAGVLNLAAKLFFGRERPKLWVSPAPEGTFSFPSGHAMGTMSLCVALVILLWPTRARRPALIFALIFVPIVGLTRMYLGVHYPSDILAGWAAALGWVVGVQSVLTMQRGRLTAFGRRFSRARVESL